MLSKRERWGSLRNPHHVYTCVRWRRFFFECHKLILDSSDQNVRSQPAGRSAASEGEGRRRILSGRYTIRALRGSAGHPQDTASRTSPSRWKMQSQLFRLLCLDGNFPSIVRFWKARDEPLRAICFAQVCKQRKKTAPPSQSNSHVASNNRSRNFELRFYICRSANMTFKG